MQPLSTSVRSVKDLTSLSTQCLVLPVLEGGDRTSLLRGADDLLAGALGRLLELSDFKGKGGEHQLLPGAGSLKRVLLVGAGKAEGFDRGGARKLAHTLARALDRTGAADAVLCTADLALSEDEGAWFCEYLARQLQAGTYRYRGTVSKPKPASKLRRFSLDPGETLSSGAARNALKRGIASALGVNAARQLANLPGNVCTPDYLAREARKLARRHARLTTQVLNERQMKELGMGSLLSVAAGSDQPARLIVMNYRGGRKNAAPHVLVGKGITFDSGGISLKPGAKMDEMKYDMGGAASVIGTLTAVLEMELPINVIGVIAAAENMPSGRATKPGDVVTSMSGKTIEVLNTDAEGRLVLCDALTYVERFKPAAVVDIATLTGACIVALGSHASGLYANDDNLAAQLLDAGAETHDRAWRMPLWDDYQKQLQSNFADIANIGGPGAGSITAACFLARFAEKYPWAHLDIAGSAWDSSPKGATGRPVPLLTQYLVDRAEAG